MRFCRIRFRQIIVHPVAVQIPAALAHVIGTDLHIILGRIYITEIAESLRSVSYTHLTCFEEELYGFRKEFWS